MVRALGAKERRIDDLTTHCDAFVTPSELAHYWRLRPALLSDYIQTGVLRAFRFGERLFRIRTADALDFERLTEMPSRRKRPARRRLKKGEAAGVGASAAKKLK
jgi:hypothetical protein